MGLPASTPRIRHSCLISRTQFPALPTDPGGRVLPGVGVGVPGGGAFGGPSTGVGVPGTGFFGGGSLVRVVVSHPGHGPQWSGLKVSV